MSNNKRRSSTESSNALSNEIEKRPRSETTDSWIDWLKSNISLTTLSPTISAEQEEQQQEEEEIVDESVEQTKQSVWSWLGYGLTAKEGSRESITTDNVVLPLFDTQFKGLLSYSFQASNVIVSEIDTKLLGKIGIQVFSFFRSSQQTTSQQSLPEQFFLGHQQVSVIRNLQSLLLLYSELTIKAFAKAINHLCLFVHLKKAKIMIFKKKSS